MPYRGPILGLFDPTIDLRKLRVDGLAPDFVFAPYRDNQAEFSGELEDEWLRPLMQACTEAAEKEPAACRPRNASVGALAFGLLVRLPSGVTCVFQNGGGSHGVFIVNKSGDPRTGHQTQKPLALMELLVRLRLRRARTRPSHRSDEGGSGAVSRIVFSVRRSVGLTRW